MALAHTEVKIKNFYPHCRISKFRKLRKAKLRCLKLKRVTTRKRVKKADNRPSKAVVITVSGPHGTGKSTYARGLAEDLRLRYVCAGELFRELAKQRGMSLESFSRYAANNPEVDHLIDERTREEAKSGSVVIDAQLAAWMVKDEADINCSWSHRTLSDSIG